ncbi:hypothetical protein KLP40_14890 [Hymenobacter sp. NST-14]|uniref:hypothetical protein n=1 Tax=Hymenobacter piscis TaxID=2839984 RepID=UPI001C00FD7C|nr:hypothetical protein [Hymenobacter piscis]MBT9394456.1 hypothetical protein [Hymenobacter piscis]
MLDYIDVARVRLGHTCPVQNPNPGKDNVALSFTPDLFHLTYFIDRRKGEHDQNWSEAFLTWPIVYGLAEPAPGVGFLLLDLKGPRQWVIEAGLTLETPGKGAAELWLRQPPREMVPLALALADTNTGEVLALRVIQVPGTMATEARALLGRQRRFLPGVLASQAQQIICDRFTSRELHSLCATTFVDIACEKSN